MPSTNWSSEDNHSYPICDARTHLLTGQEVAFINQIRNKDPLTFEDSEELRRLHFKVDAAN